MAIDLVGCRNWSVNKAINKEVDKWIYLLEFALSIDPAHNPLGSLEAGTPVGARAEPMGWTDGAGHVADSTDGRSSVRGAHMERDARRCERGTVGHRECLCRCVASAAIIARA